MKPTLAEIREVHARSLPPAGASIGGWRAAYAQDVGALLAELERLSAIRSGRIRVGMVHAIEEGHKPGRPRKDVDVARAATMWSEGMSVKAIALAMGVDRNTIRRRLRELGLDTSEWVGTDATGRGTP